MVDHSSNHRLCSWSKGRRGFTLIEIISVLIILGVLASVAIPRYIDMQDRSSQLILADGLAAGFSACSVTYVKGLLTTQTFSCQEANNNVSTAGDITVLIGPAGQTTTCLVQVSNAYATSQAVWYTPSY